MNNLIKNNIFVGEIKKVVSPKEYLSIVKKDSSRSRIQSVRFKRPEIGNTNDLGKFIVTFK